MLKNFFSKAVKVPITYNSRASMSVQAVAPESKERVVKNLRNVAFKPSKKLDFEAEGGRCLLYYFKSNFLTYKWMYAKLLIPFGIVANLIKYNPFYMTFPAALPLMLVVECYCKADKILKKKRNHLKENIMLRQMYNVRKKTHFVVREVYLLPDGETLEVIFDKQFYRKLKKDEVNTYFHIPAMKTPPQNENMKPLSGTLFPEHYPIEDSERLGFSWNKYYINPLNYIVMPRNPNYANWEILVETFKGNTIEMRDQYVNIIDYAKKDKYQLPETFFKEERGLDILEGEEVEKKENENDQTDETDNKNKEEEKK